MPVLGLTLLALYGLLAFGLRMAIQLRRTGSSGFIAMRGSASSLEWACALLFMTAVVLCVAGLLLSLIKLLPSVAVLNGDLVTLVGIMLASVGIVLTLVAQLAMGDAWRIGVAPSERTKLVTHSPFSLVRNPIFAAMIPSFAGVALLAPNILAIGGAALVIVALELQTRLVEEPYLSMAHGTRYAVYAARTGRFLPGVGRLRLPSSGYR